MAGVSEATVNQDEVWLVVRQANTPSTTVALVDELTIGRDVGAASIEGHLTVAGDPSVSRLHAILLNKGPGWCVQAPQVTNGLFLNGARMADGAVQLLSDGDEMRLGERTVVTFRSLRPSAPDRSRTRAAAVAPELTAAERRVLVCLCLPLIDGDAFTPPADVAAMAAQLFVTESAIKQHLGRIFDKFAIPDGRNRRVLLANDALQRGVVRRADLEAFRATRPTQ